MRIGHIVAGFHYVDNLLGDAFESSGFLGVLTLVDLVLAVHIRRVWHECSCMALVVLTSASVVITRSMRLLLSLDEGLSQYLPR